MVAENNNDYDDNRETSFAVVRLGEIIFVK